MDGPLTFTADEDLSENAAAILDTLASDIPFWDSLIAKREHTDHFNIQEIEHVGDITQRDIDAQYDLTNRRVEQIFKRFDRNQDNQISPDEIKQGLQAQGFPLDPEALSRLTIAMDVEKKGMMSIQKFAVVLQRLKLAELFSPSVLRLEQKMAAEMRYAILPMRNGNTPNPVLCEGNIKVCPNTEGPNHCSLLNVTDYSMEGAAPPEWPVTDLKGFFFGKRQAQGRHPDGVRWVHTQGLDKIMLLRLAVKYRLHPLAVEDALEMCHQPAKVDRYGNQFFCAINALQLDERTKKKNGVGR